MLDLFNREIVGYSAGPNMDARLVYEAFASIKLDKAGMVQSMSRVGRCIDNGPIEGFWGILKCEMYYLSQFHTYHDLQVAINKYIHFYNYERRQKKLDILAPMSYRLILENAA